MKKARTITKTYEIQMTDNGKYCMQECEFFFSSKVSGNHCTLENHIREAPWEEILPEEDGQLPRVDRCREFFDNGDQE